MSLDLAEQLPEVVKAAASAFDHVDSMVVLNGAQGVTEVLGQLIAQGSTLLNAAKQMNGNGNGSVPAHAPTEETRA